MKPHFYFHPATFSRKYSAALYSKDRKWPMLRSSNRRLGCNKRVGYKHTENKQPVGLKIRKDFSPLCAPTECLTNASWNTCSKLGIGLPIHSSTPFGSSPNHTLYSKTCAFFSSQKFMRCSCTNPKLFWTCPNCFWSVESILKCTLDLSRTFYTGPKITFLFWILHFEPRRFVPVKKFVHVH